MVVPCDWPAHPRVRACVTTRQGGVSEGPYASLNLADHVGDRPEAVAENRARLRAALELPAEPAWLRQVHGTRVAGAAAAPGPEPTEADGACTDRPGVVCAVLTADCLPVLLSDRAGTRVAALHAGWRGLAAGVLEAGVGALACPPRELIAWVGPGIGPQAFEVGDEVREAFVAGTPAHGRFFTPRGGSAAAPAGAGAGAPHPAGAPSKPHGGPWLADLPGLARSRLLEAGVGHVTVSGACTFRDRERWFSYRRDGGVTGRMATLIWLAP